MRICFFTSVLQVVIDQSFGQFIRIEVKDEDKIDRDDSLGKCVIRLVCHILSWKQRH